MGAARGSRHSFFLEEPLLSRLLLSLSFILLFRSEFGALATTYFFGRTCLFAGLVEQPSVFAALLFACVLSYEGGLFLPA